MLEAVRVYELHVGGTHVYIQAHLERSELEFSIPAFTDGLGVQDKYKGMIDE